MRKNQKDEIPDLFSDLELDSTSPPESFPDSRKRVWLKPIITIVGILAGYFLGINLPLCEILAPLCQ